MVILKRLNGWREIGIGWGLLKFILKGYVKGKFMIMKVIGFFMIVTGILI